LDPEFSALLQKTVGPRIGELPSPGISLPLGGVELDAPDSEAMDQRLEVLQARFAVPRVPGTVEDQPVGMLLLETAVLLGGVEPVLVEVLQVGGLKDAHVDISVDEDILHHPVSAVLLEQRLIPHIVGRAKVPMVVVEAADEPGAVLVGLVVGAGIPQVHMPVDDEDLLASARLEHGVASLMKAATPDGSPYLDNAVASIRSKGWIWSLVGGPIGRTRATGTRGV